MKRLTFTFDNGPAPGATERLLDLLCERGVKTTFFLVGRKLEDPAGRALAARAHAEGHWIGNHTLSHGEPLGGEGAGSAAEEIGEAQRLLGPLSHSRKFFRPNGAGALGPHLLSVEAYDYLRKNAYTVVTWNNVPGDFREPHDQWLENALSTLDETDWTLLVLHDEHICRMLPLLERFLDEIEARRIRLEQDFPRDCLLLDRGRPTGARPEDYVAFAGPVAAAATRGS